MSITKFKLSGEEYVIIPRRQYERVASLLAEDSRTAARAQKSLDKFRAGKLKTIPHVKVKRILGL